MASERWREAFLGAEVDLLTGFPFPSNGYTSDPSGVPLVRGDNVIQGQFRWEDVKRWPLEDAERFADYTLAPGDVVVAMDRPWIEAGLKYAAIAESELPCLLVQRVARLRAKDTLDQRFLRYVIGSRAFTNYILGVQTGTAVPHISGAQIKAFRFLCPPLHQQERIGEILGTLDDSIDLNRRMNKTLEAMAAALFKAWFADFEPVYAKARGETPRGIASSFADLLPSSFYDSQLGRVPQGWRVASVGDVVQVVGGSTPSTKEPKYWENGHHYWATPKDLAGLQSPALLETERRITDTGVRQISSGLLPHGTVLLSSRAPIGYLAIAEMPVAINQGFIAMVCRGDVSNHYILHWAQTNMDTIKGRANGTTFQEISKANFRPIQMVVPPRPIMDAFTKQADALHRKLVHNLQESRTLAALRDILLPRLLSGEIRVREAESAVGAAV